MSDSKYANAAIGMRPFSIKLDKLDRILAGHETPLKHICDCLKDLASHPTILEIDRKMSRILQLLEDKHTQESDFSFGGKYFPGI
jgi:hypothetical protein